MPPKGRLSWRTFDKPAEARSKNSPDSMDISSMTMVLTIFRRTCGCANGQLVFTQLATERLDCSTEGEGFARAWQTSEEDTLALANDLHDMALLLGQHWVLYACRM
mmetsp:Transcript_41942/g.72668  ORF Transcript_41942/g.72668 Transcript_41942/m.72668 type:complete len:106 (+) Transcript_41942:1075-1392(+)